MFILASISTGDWVALIGTIATIILGTGVVVAQTKTRTQRDFFIKEIDALKSDYLEFARQIRSGDLSAEAIRDEFRNYSDRISMLVGFISQEYATIDNKLFDSHGTFQGIVTGYDSVEEQFSFPSVNLTHQEKTSLDRNLLSVHKSFIELIIKVNKASKHYPFLDE